MDGRMDALALLWHRRGGHGADGLGDEGSAGWAERAGAQVQVQVVDERFGLAGQTHFTAIVRSNIGDAGRHKLLSEIDLSDHGALVSQLELRRLQPPMGQP